MKTLTHTLGLSLLLTLFIISSNAASAQSKAHMRDSLRVLNSRIDSLIAVCDSLNTIYTAVAEDDNSGEGNSWTDDFINFDDLEEEGADADSMLSIWYLQNIGDPLELNFEEMEDKVLASNIPDSVYIARLNAMGSYIQVPYNDIVRNYIVLYSQRIADKTARILGRARYYLPLFEEILLKYNLPQELKAMAIIESALDSRAVSRAGATGMWQFMYAAGRQYGLQIDSYVDERLDPIAACEAAAKYLSDSYKIFGDWSLAIASYNCGPGNVNKAIRRSGGGRDFWEVYKYLPKETRGYVPAFVGALYTLRYYNEHNIVPATVNIPAHVDTFHISRNLHLGQVSELIGIPIAQLRDANPQYKHDIIPGAENSHTYILRIPYTYTSSFVDVENEVYTYKDTIYLSQQKLDAVKTGTAPRTNGGSSSGNVVYHKVKSGETLGAIASRYHTTVANIKQWNGLKSNTIRVNQKLKIYTKGGTAAKSTTTASTSTNSSTATTSEGGYVTYTVRQGDSLWGISQKFAGVNVQQIMKLNGLNNNSKITPGMKLKIKQQ